MAIAQSVVPLHSLVFILIKDDPVFSITSSISMLTSMLNKYVIFQVNRLIKACNYTYSPIRIFKRPILFSKRWRTSPKGNYCCGKTRADKRPKETTSFWISCSGRTDTWIRRRFPLIIRIDSGNENKTDKNFPQIFRIFYYSNRVIKCWLTWTMYVLFANIIDIVGYTNIYPFALKECHWVWKTMATFEIFFLEFFWLVDLNFYLNDIDLKRKVCHPIETHMMNIFI